MLTTEEALVAELKEDDKKKTVGGSTPKRHGRFLTRSVRPSPFVEQTDLRPDPSLDFLPAGESRNAI